MKANFVILNEMAMAFIIITMATCPKAIGKTTKKMANVFWSSKMVTNLKENI